MSSQREGNAALLRECRVAWDGWERFSSSSRALPCMFAWAFAEAIFWPLIPEFLLVPMAAASRRPYLPVVASIVGSALGGIALYVFAFAYPRAGLTYLVHLPLTGPREGAVGAELVARGARAFLSQPLSGIPFKVWAIVGASEHISPAQAIPIFIAARGLRMATFATLARGTTRLFAGFFRDFSLFILGIYLVLVFYGWWQTVR